MMIALIQRVSSASVSVDGKVVGAIGRGLLALVGIEVLDTTDSAAKLLDRMLCFRIFADEAGKMNLNINQIDGGLLLVPQFTLVADTRKGTRPSFSRGAPPAQAEIMFNDLIAQARKAHPAVATGQFGADMQVSLTNDGPVTFWLEARNDHRD
jgi:D-aminoacyl-tRNA deacylase